jgi:hypothetical protein
MTPDEPRPDPDTPLAHRPGWAADPPRSADELASALLDGELTGTAADEARQRPDVVARLAALEAVRASLRAAPVPPPGGAAREAAIAAALAAFDAPAAAPGGGARIDSLDARRAGRREAARRWLGAAAAVAVIGAGIAGIAALGSSSDSDAGDSAAGGMEEGMEDAGSGSSEGGSGAAEATQPPGSTDESMSRSGADGATGAPRDLGSFASAADLAAAVGSLTETPGSDAAPTAPSVGDDTASEEGGALGPICPWTSVDALTAAGATPVLQGRATVAGVVVDVWLVDAPSGRRVVAVDDSCAVVVERDLD